eukprot:m.114168 g.114168  ORF g.114168 m.114168 type:complete len:229 (-) comp16281_c1_seq1:196-882(-)
MLAVACVALLLFTDTGDAGAVSRVSSDVCPSAHTVAHNTSIHLDAYGGIWYKTFMSKFFYRAAQRDYDCIRVDMGSPVWASSNGVGSFAYHLNETATLSTTGQHIANNVTIETGSTSLVNASGEFVFYDNTSTFWRMPYVVVYLSAEYDVVVLYSCDVTRALDGLWVMARTPTLPPGYTLNGLLDIAKAKGVNTHALDMLVVPQTNCQRPAHRRKPQTDASRGINENK